MRQRCTHPIHKLNELFLLYLEGIWTDTSQGKGERFEVSMEPGEGAKFLNIKKNDQRVLHFRDVIYKFHRYFSRLTGFFSPNFVFSREA